MRTIDRRLSIWPTTGTSGENSLALTTHVGREYKQEEEELQLASSSSLWGLKLAAAGVMYACRWFY